MGRCCFVDMHLLALRAGSAERKEQMYTDNGFATARATRHSVVRLSATANHTLAVLYSCPLHIRMQYVCYAMFVSLSASASYTCPKSDRVLIISEI
jgi:hypothetical protein